MAESVDTSSTRHGNGMAPAAPVVALVDLGCEGAADELAAAGTVGEPMATYGGDEEP